MKQFDISKHSSAMKQQLKDVLKKHGAEHSFKFTNVYTKSLKATLDSLRLQEEQFADFVIRKQKEIDNMEAGIIKNELQEHLNKIAVQTYEHLSKLSEKYQWMLKGSNDKQNSIKTNL